MTPLLSRVSYVTALTLKSVQASGATRANGNLILSRYPLSAKGSVPLSYDRSATYVT